MNVNTSRFGALQCRMTWGVFTIKYFHLIVLLPSLGLPPDPAQQRYPGSSGCRPTNHTASSKPSPAPVGSKELWMCVQHPEQNPARPSRAIQQLLYTVPEHVGKNAVWVCAFLISCICEWSSHSFHIKHSPKMARGANTFTRLKKIPWICPFETFSLVNSCNSAKQQSNIFFFHGVHLHVETWLALVYYDAITRPFCSSVT